MALEFMDVQNKDNKLYGLLVLMGLAAIVLAFLGNPYISVLITAVIGFTIALHLHHEKMESLETVVCPIGQHCFDVITSKYSNFLGISVEIYGMFYYGLIFSGYLIALLFDVPAWFSFILLANTTIALLFSAYLTWIQAVPLGKWCIWCVTSATCCILIFAFAITGLSMPVAELLAMFQAVPQAVYFFGIAVGMGMAFAGDALFLSFLKDFEMTERQAYTINALNELMWAALAFAVLGAVGYFYPDPGLFYRPESLVSLLSLAVIIVNGALLYFWASHDLKNFRFRKEEEDPVDAEIVSKRRKAFVLLGVSAASWVTLFALTFFQIPERFATFDILLPAYGAFIVFGVLDGLFAEYIFKQSATDDLKSRIPLLFD